MIHLNINKTIIHHLKSLFVFSFILCHSVAALSQNPTVDKPTLSFFKANYNAVINGIGVAAYREYKPLDNDLAEINFTASSWLANLKETAQFSWVGDTIQPLSFSSVRNITGVKKASELNFNHSDKILTRVTKKQEEPLNYMDGALDRLSFQLQLQQDLLLNKHGITYNIVNRSSIKKNQFEILGEETISTKAGDFKTVKIKVVREKKKRVTFIWVAPEWEYLFVRLIQLKDEKKQFSIELTDAIVGNQTVVGIQK